MVEGYPPKGSVGSFFPAARCLLIGFLYDANCGGTAVKQRGKGENCRMVKMREKKNREEDYKNQN